MHCECVLHIPRRSLSDPINLLVYQGRRQQRPFVHGGLATRMKGVTSKATAGGSSGASKGPKKESASSAASAPDRGSSGFRPRDERQEQLERDHELFLQAFESKTS